MLTRANPGLKSVTKLIEAGDGREAFRMLSDVCTADADFSLQHRYQKIIAKIPATELGLEPIKIAMLATSTIDHFADIFRFWLSLRGFDANIFMAEYDTVDQTVLDPTSELYEFAPDVIWLFTSHRDVPDQFANDRGDLASEPGMSSIDRFRGWWERLQQSCSAHIIQNNADLPAERVFGNFEGQTRLSRLNRLREFNLQLAAAAPSGVSIFDLDHLSALYGKGDWFNPRFWYHSKHAFALDAVGRVAFEGAALVHALRGRARKCLVLDLDNTLWGGVIGDDGVEGIKLGHGPAGEAYVDFQRYIKSLKNRGIILAVCSKNDAENARLPFLQHSDMVLHIDDISAFVANWDNKADNICLIAETLQIGLDSMVFVDDDPVERALISQMLPEVAVPEMPGDPALYVRTLDRECYFETVSFSQEDAVRGDMYRSNVQRKRSRQNFRDLTEFLRSLEMKSVVADFDTLQLPRISQLINKSNQFHLTTKRYTESAIAQLMADGNHICRYFKMRDTFGDNGVISLIILEISAAGDLLVDTWVMSCRVLSRGVEDFVHNEMVRLATVHGASRIVGKYIPTAKNGLVAGLYQRLGFELAIEENGITTWHYALPPTVATKRTHIEKVNSY